ncbi:MAG: ComEC/Rec2 family competence protein [Muribaculaceae bacterium]|nr:ComEC/Rec2 family competence protein [Muribaculaceae bacterium]
MNIELKNTPLLRLLIPTLLGIIFISARLPIYVVAGLFFLGLLFLFFFNKKYIIDYSLFFIVFIISAINAKILEPEYIEIPNDYKTTVTRIDIIDDKDTYINAVASILCLVDSNGNKIETPDVKTSITMQGNNYALKEGDIIAFKSGLETIENYGNPEEFDYKSYQKRKGILYRVFIPNNQYKVVGYDETISTLSYKIRRNLTKYILNSNLSAESQQFIIAIILGDKQYIDKETKTTFAHIGIAHILALSGLHIGIITFLLYLLLFPLDYIGGKKIRLIIIWCFLLIYAIITGLSPSVLRAVIMTAFASIAFINYRANYILNAVCGAALLLLWLNPYNIYDVGFQLSFASIISIILLTSVTNTFTKNRPILSAIKGVIMTSIAAVLGTTMFSAYYFHCIPLIFIIPNIILIPLLPIIILIGIISLLTNVTFFTDIFNHIILFMNNSASILENIPFAYINNIDIPYWYIFLNILFILSLFLLLKSKKIFFLNAIIIIFVIIGAFELYRNIQPKPSGLIVFNDYKETPVLVYKDGKGLFMPNVNDDYIKDFSSYNIAFTSKRKIESLDKLHIRANNLYYSFSYNNKIFIVVNNNIPKRDFPENKKLICDYLIISNSFYGDIKRISRYFSPKCIILSGNIYNNKIEILKRQCKELKIRYIALHETGAFTINQ